MQNFMQRYSPKTQPRKLQDYLQLALERQYQIEIGRTVSFQREGYSFQNGVVHTLHEGLNAAVVMWTDERGWTHQAVCGCEFLRVQARETKAPTGEPISA